MRVLAIDHGEARCGVAISDPTGTLVRPLDPIAPEPGAVRDLAAAEGADRIVVGLPLGLAGSEGAQAVVVRSFCEALSAETELPVETYDERFTTRMADATARSTGTAASRDSLAAAHLLESYLESEGSA